MADTVAPPTLNITLNPGPKPYPTPGLACCCPYHMRLMLQEKATFLEGLRLSGFLDSEIMPVLSPPMLRSAHLANLATSCER